MALALVRCEATLGAVITGVKLSALDAAEFAAIEAAFHAHALLIFPAQHLSARQQADFARRFGAIEHIAPGVDTIPLSNRRPDGTLLAEGDSALRGLLGNEGWHTDSSYMPLAAKASVLSALVVPAQHGETEWADMRAAWEALDPGTRERIAALAAHHSIRYSQARAGLGDDYAAYGSDVAEPPLRPLVKRHPVTGRPALYIGRHAHAIPGLAPRESERLLDELMDFACRAPRIWRHRWAPGDVAIWDNRCVLHRARPWDHREPRVMQHTRIAGDPATERAGSGDASGVATGAAQS